MQTNATQIARALGPLYTLTGSLDAPGGNVLFPAVPAANAGGLDLRPDRAYLCQIRRAD